MINAKTGKLDCMKTRLLDFWKTGVIDHPSSDYGVTRNVEWKISLIVSSERRIIENGKLKIEN